MISVILTFLLSGIVLSSSLVGTSYGSQVQTQTKAQAQASSSSSPTQTPPSSQASPLLQPRPICNLNSPALQSGSTGAKVTELQRILTLVGYGSLLGQSGIDGKFATSTQNAVKKFQQDNRIPVDGKVGPITWGVLCSIVPNSFIIQLKSTNPEMVGNLRETLAAAGGTIAAVYEQFRMLNVRFERAPTNMEQFINSLKAHPAVQGVFNDAIGTTTQLLPTGMDRIDAELSAARSGDGVGTVDADIAIIDTGVNRHPDLNVFQCVSFLTFFPIPECNDQRGHGTHVAGIAAAKDNNIGVVGSAPGARIWALKIFGNTNRYLTSDLMKALNFVALNAKDIEVVNLSLAGIGFSQPEIYAITFLTIRGVAVVAAAGNNNLDAGSFIPARDPLAITVSAITDTDGKCGGAGPAIQAPPAQPPNITQDIGGISNPDDFVASYSNYGSVVDLAAPGTRILSTANTGGYVLKSGTSMAAPHVAGAAALYMSLHPASPFQVDAFLKSIGTKASATDNPRVPCDGAGRGYIDDRYPDDLIFTDKVKEPLLYMGGIK